MTTTADVIDKLPTRVLNYEEKIVLVEYFERLWMPTFFRFLYRRVIKIHVSMSADRNQEKSDLDKRNLLYSIASNSALQFDHSDSKLAFCRNLVCKYVVPQPILASLQETLVRLLAQSKTVSVNNSLIILAPHMLRWNAFANTSVLVFAVLQVACFVIYQIGNFNGITQLSRDMRGALHQSPAYIDNYTSVYYICVLAVLFFAIKSIKSQTTAATGAATPNIIYAEHLELTNDEFDEFDELNNEEHDSILSEASASNSVSSNNSSDVESNNAECDSNSSNNASSISNSDSEESFLETVHLPKKTVKISDCQSKKFDIPTLSIDNVKGNPLSITLPLAYKPFLFLQTYAQDIVFTFSISTARSAAASTLFTIVNLLFIVAFSSTMLRIFLLPLVLPIRLVLDFFADDRYFWIARDVITALLISMNLELKIILQTGKWRLKIKEVLADLVTLFCKVVFFAPIVSILLPNFYSWPILDVVQFYVALSMLRYVIKIR